MKSLIVFCIAGTLAAQTATKPPRTADGYPDFEGAWNISTVTPFERPADLKDKLFFTPEEGRAFEKDAVSRVNRDRRSSNAEADVSAAYNEFWYEPGTHLSRTLRTSVIVDPPDGRMPALTPSAQKTLAARRAIQNRSPEGPEDRSLGERCLFFGQEGPPLTPGPYNNNYRIFQTKDYVAINVEALHDTRIIPLNNTPHLPPSVHLWFGDSRGHYEGDTLVIDATNFTDKNPYRGSDTNLHVVERLTRLNPDTLVYRFTVEDPTAFAKPFTGEYTLASESGYIYEYACHEGNYALGNILKGARAEEKK